MILGGHGGFAGLTAAGAGGDGLARAPASPSASAHIVSAAIGEASCKLSFPGAAPGATACGVEFMFLVIRFNIGLRPTMIGRSGRGAGEVDGCGALASDCRQGEGGEGGEAGAGEPDGWQMPLVGGEPLCEVNAFPIHDDA